jgi:hypothetical protein
MPLKHVLSVMDIINHSRTPKLWAIAHENGPKMQKRRVLGNGSQIYTDCYILVNLHGTLKQWKLAHNNGPKMC